jgi:hypothetical protein
MKRLVTVTTTLLALVLALAGTTLAQSSSVPEIPYRSVPDFLKLPPNMYLGEVSGVAVNSKGHVFVFHRGNTTGPAYAAAGAQLLEFSPDGKFIREIGHNLYAWSFAHDVKVDRNDNVWVTDKGSDMIIKFNPEGHVVMVIGHRPPAVHPRQPFGGGSHGRRRAGGGHGPLPPRHPPHPADGGGGGRHRDRCRAAGRDGAVRAGALHRRGGGHRALSEVPCWPGG